MKNEYERSELAEILKICSGESYAEDALCEIEQVLKRKFNVKPRFPVGVSVLLTQGSKVLVGKRINNTASGMLSTPGGRVEFFEPMINCAVREVREETGLVVEPQDFRVLGFKEQIRYGDHYFMNYFHATKFVGVLQNREPKKCESWRWADPNDLTAENCTEPADILAALFTV